jgi:hypothetical protein
MGLILAIVGIGGTFIYDWIHALNKIERDRRIKTRLKLQSVIDNMAKARTAKSLKRDLDKISKDFNKNYFQTDEASSAEEFIKKFKASVENNQKALGRETDGSIEDADEQSLAPKKKKTVRKTRPPPKG